MSEDELRDKLSQNLELIDSDLTLIKNEFYLPNSEGTRGFVDILAKTNKQYVIIELKKSNQTSREAIHELFKYHESLKKLKGLKDSEIKCVIVSTEWHELLMPFSSFCKAAPFEVIGFLLQLDDKNNPKACTNIRPLEITSDRLIGSVHDLRLYYNDQSLNKGIIDHASSFAKKRIVDYVMVVLEVDEEFSKMCAFKWIIYSAIRRLSIEQYRDILSADKAQLKETDSVATDFDGNELYEHYENSVLGNLQPWPAADYIEISYPAKFAHKLLVDEKWKIKKIIRHGVFLENDLLTESEIVNEISGSEATSPGKLSKTCTLSNKAEIASLMSALDRCFAKGSVEWLQQIKLIISEISSKSSGKNTELTLDVINVNNILISIYHQLVTSKKTKAFYMPHYSILVKNKDDNSVLHYYGYVGWNNKVIPFIQIFHKYFDSDAFRLVMPMMWGGLESNDASIMHDLGFTYESIRVIADENYMPISIEKLVNYNFKKISTNFRINTDFNNFVTGNRDFVEELINTIERKLINIDMKNK